MHKNKVRPGKYTRTIKYAVGELFDIRLEKPRSS